MNTREEYLAIRHDDFTIVYTYYMQNLGKSKKEIRLSPHEFAQAFMMWEFGGDALTAIKLYYDALYNVITIHTGKKTIYA